MSVPANQEQDRSRQAAIIAITQARDQIGENFAWATERGSTPEGAAKEPTTGQLGHTEANAAQANEHASAPEGTARESASDQLPVTREPRRVALKIIIGLVTVAGVCAAAFGWQSMHGKAAPDPVSTSSLPKAVQSNPTSKDNLTKAEVNPHQSPPLVQSSGQSATAASMSAIPPATAQSIELLSRQIAKLEQAIEQLSNRQIRLDRDNADFAAHLNTMREQIARDNAAVVDQLKAAQAQMALDHVNMAEQLKAVQSQLAHDNAVVSEQLKASQEQMGKVIAKTLEHSPRPKPLQQTTAKPVSTLRSPQTTAQPLVPRAQ